MLRKPLIGIVIALTCSLSFAAVTAAASRKPIKATLPSGYTLVAIAKNGVATQSSARSVSLRPPAAKFSLHLLRNSRYYGPVVVSTGSKSRVITGFAAGGSLGRISPKGGYATVKASNDASLVSSISAQANKGKPVGAGNLGVVGIGKRLNNIKSASAQAADSEGGIYKGVTQTKADGGVDTDRDGLPNAFDLDDNGTHTTDNVDPATAKAISDTHTPIPWISPSLGGSLPATVNAGAGGVTQAALDSLFSQYAKLQFGLYSQSGHYSAVGVDPVDLSFLKSAEIFGPLSPAVPTGKPWSSFNPGKDGLLSLYQESPSSGFYLAVKPHVTSSELVPGTPLAIVATEQGKTTQLSGSVPTYFITTPAVSTISAGNATTKINYPINSGDPGTYGVPISVASGKISFTIFRPQRPVITGETGVNGMVSMGGLSYAVEPTILGQTMPTIGCKANYYSDLSPTLAAVNETTISYDTLFDNAADAPPAPDQVVSFTLDVGQCLADKGVATSGVSVDLRIIAYDQNKPNRGDTEQPLSIKLP